MSCHNVNKPRVWLTGSTFRRMEHRGFLNLENPLSEYVTISPNDGVEHIEFQWGVASELSSLHLMWGSFNGRVFEPDRDWQQTRLEMLKRQEWKPLGAELRVDERYGAAFTTFRECGFVLWTYRFAPVSAFQLRLALPKLTEPIVLLGFTFNEPPAIPVPEHVSAVPPSWNGLAASSITRSADSNDALLLQLPHPAMVDCVTVASGVTDPQRVRLYWRKGDARYAVADAQYEAGETGLTIRFSPVAVSELALEGVAEDAQIRVQCTRCATEFFDNARFSLNDELKHRLGVPEREPSYDEVEATLLPMNYKKSVIGRVNDAVETVVIWNGAFLMIENGEQGDCDTGGNMGWSSWDFAGTDAWVDRWFAPTIGAGRNAEIFGWRYENFESRRARGYLPIIENAYSHQGLRYTQKLFVTAPADAVYANVMRMEVTNPTEVERDTEVSVVMGRCRSASIGGPLNSPPLRCFDFLPLNTGYRLDEDCRTVRDAAGTIVFHSFARGRLNGNSRESVFTAPLRLNPGETVVLTFVVPHVLEPITDADTLGGLDPDRAESLTGAYWEDVLARASTLEFPDPLFDRAWRQCLLQNTMILNDDGQLKYGAYWYEEYYGLEEMSAILSFAYLGDWETALEHFVCACGPGYTDPGNYHFARRISYLINTGCQLYSLAPDKERFPSHLVVRMGEWAQLLLDRVRNAGHVNKRFDGLLPRHYYGGDIHWPAVNLFINISTAYSLLRFRRTFSGNPALTAQMEREIEAYADKVREVSEWAIKQSPSKNFLPAALDVETDRGEMFSVEPEPRSLMESRLSLYWNLLSVFEFPIFGVESDLWKKACAFKQTRGGVLLNLTRFRRIGADIDAPYGHGYQHYLLETGQKNEFLTALYADLAHAVSRNHFSGPEASNIFPQRVSNEAMHAMYYGNIWGWGRRDIFHNSEPLCFVSGVILNLIRAMIVFEETDEEGQYNGCVRVLEGIPSHWFRKPFAFRRLPTFAGELSIENAPSGDGKTTVTIETDFPEESAVVLCPERWCAVESCSLDGTPVKKERIERQARKDCFLITLVFAS